MSNPQTELKLMTVPWSSDYKNLRFFDSVTSQNTWFTGRSGKSYNGMTALKFGFPYTIKGNYNEISKYNYLRFRNPQYGNTKWYYAFIDRVEYRSEGSSDIYFTCDYYQTYLSDISFGQTFIERHHTAGDTVPLTDEPLGGGDMSYQFNKNLWTGNTDYVMVCSSRLEGDAKNPCKNTGQAVAEGMFLYTSKNADDKIKWLNDHINNYVAKPDEIKAIYAVRSDSFTGNFSGGGEIQKYTVSKTMSIKKPTKIGNFTPKNKKTLYYPYCYCMLTNNQGGSQVFRFENCTSDTIEFRCGGRLSATPSFVCNAINMKDENGSYSPVYLNGAPSVSCNSSYYNGYMQRNQMDIGFQVAGTTVSTAANLLAKNIPGALASAGGGITSLLSSQNAASYAPNPSQVAGSTVPFLFDLNKYNFSLYTVRCRENYLKRVDAFFTKFGYNVQNIGTPNPKNRTSFYYCKTTDAIIKGAVPQEGRLLLQNALDNGVTFWRIDDIGNYSVSNT